LVIDFLTGQREKLAAAGRDRDVTPIIGVPGWPGLPASSARRPIGGM